MSLIARLENQQWNCCDSIASTSDDTTCHNRILPERQPLGSEDVWTVGLIFIDFILRLDRDLDCSKHEPVCIKCVRHGIIWIVQVFGSLGGRADHQKTHKHDQLWVRTFSITQRLSAHQLMLFFYDFFFFFLLLCHANGKCCSWRMKPIQVVLWSAMLTAGLQMQAPKILALHWLTGMIDRSHRSSAALSSS